MITPKTSFNRLSLSVLIASTMMLAATQVVADPTKHGHGAHAHADVKPVASGVANGVATATATKKKPDRSITVDMTDDMRFTSSDITINQGETIRFVIRNRGKLMHEMVIGTMEELKSHAEMMKKHPGMEHDEEHGAEVKAGKTGSLVRQFNKPGVIYFACLIPGHFEAGMTGKITVVKKAAK